jgi:hypothetical protein
MDGRASLASEARQSITAHLEDGWPRYARHDASRRFALTGGVGLDRLDNKTHLFMERKSHDVNTYTQPHAPASGSFMDGFSHGYRRTKIQSLSH